MLLGATTHYFIMNTYDHFYLSAVKSNFRYYGCRVYFQKKIITHATEILSVK
jgi:hypothetical protein